MIYDDDIDTIMLAVCILVYIAGVFTGWLFL